MTELQAVLVEISKTTQLIENKYPFIYVHLDEMPMYHFNFSNNITLVEFKNYLESLKEMIKHYEENQHKLPLPRLSD